MLLPTVIRTNPFPYSEALHDASLSAFRADCPKSVMIRIYLCFIIVLNLYVSCFLVHKSRSTLSSFTLRESPQRDPEQKKKSTKFDRVIEDFIGKRYGAGEAFYGKRLSDLDEDTYQEMQDLKKPKSYDEKPPRDNAIIIYGSLDAIGQYVCFELAEKGFNIRILTNNRKAAINIFGLPGNNVDILELYPESSLDSYLKALDGAQAIIFCGNFEPKINLFLGECRAYNTVAMKLLDVAKAGKLSKTVSIQKVIQISRYTTSKFTPASITDFISRSDSVLCSEFRNLNLQLEDYIRGSTIEYAIVRAPSIVESAREGSRFDLRVYQESPETSSDLSLIGVLDLAECACQALLLDVVDKTFHIAEDGVSEGSSIDEDEPIITSAAMEEEFGVVERKKVISSRVPRKAYYSILDMDDTDMRSSYMIKAEEAYLAQIEEDRLLESYWKSQFSGLSPDSRA